MKIHETFQNLHRGAIEATQMLLSAPLWEGTTEETLEHLQNWCDVVADVYDIPHVRLELVDPRSVGGVEGGAYLPQQDQIGLTRPAIPWMMHQFRHHMQFYGKATYSDLEMDAVGWAMSLIWRSSPQHLRMLACEGAAVLRPQELVDHIASPDAGTALTDEESIAFEELSEMFMDAIEPGSDLDRLMNDLHDDGEDI